jgi:hypothetical protein
MDGTLIDRRKKMTRLKLLIIALSFFVEGSSSIAQIAALPGIPSQPPSIQNNLNSAVDPTSSNDQSQGYQVGSLWQNSTTGRLWISRSVATGFAVWTLLELSDNPGYVSGRWYLPSNIYSLSTGSAPGAGSIRLYPAYIKERITLNALGIRITTLSAGGNVQAAIYAVNTSTGLPTGTALASTSSISTAATGNLNSAVNLQLEPGIYWFATNCDNGVAIFTGTLNSSPLASTIIGSTTEAATLQSSGGLQGFSVSQTFGTWPDLTSASLVNIASATSIPIVQFKIASVP